MEIYKFLWSTHKTKDEKSRKLGKLDFLPFSVYNPWSWFTNIPSLFRGFSVFVCEFSNNILRYIYTNCWQHVSVGIYQQCFPFLQRKFERFRFDDVTMVSDNIVIFIEIVDCVQLGENSIIRLQMEIFSL